MRWSKVAPGLAAGTSLGGLIIGFSEAVYYAVPKVYAAFFYGALWATAGTVLGVLWAVLRRRRARTSPKPILRGLMLSLGVSLVVLTRFVVWRDLYLESPDKNWLSLGIGLCTGLLAALCLAALSRAITRSIATDSLLGPWLWTIPLITLLGFVLVTREQDDRICETPPPASQALRGQGVILVVADALRADALGTYGASKHRGAPPSPRVDAFAQAARIFTRASAQASWTRPAVASIFTSRHPSGHQTVTKAAALPAELPTLASTLAAAGVKTAAVVTNYNLEPAYGLARGFVDYRYLAPARYLGAPQAANRLAAYNAYRLVIERFVKVGREARFFYRSGAAVNAQALDLLDKIGNDKFFLYLHYMEPHDPYFSVTGESYARVSNPKPPAAWADSMHAAYGDEVQRFDRHLGELLDGLQARGLDETTTVIVMSDHGEEFAEHGGFYHGLTLYQEMLHVPLIIHAPGMLRGNDDRLVSQIDVAPTVLARLGVPVPASFEGRDLFADAQSAESVLAEEDHEGNVLQSLRVGNHKLIIANANNPRGLKPVELYDLTKDPREQHSLGQSPLVDRMTQALSTELARARVGSGRARTRKTDAATEAELRALGYVR